MRPRPGEDFWFHPVRFGRCDPCFYYRVPPGRVEFTFGFPVDLRVKDLVDAIPEGAWYPAIQTDGDLCEGAWVAEVTGVGLARGVPAPQERPHPGAQLTFTDADGMRITAFLTDTPAGQVPGQVAGLELRHRQHARVETGSVKPRPRSGLLSTHSLSTGQPPGASFTR